MIESYFTDMIDVISVTVDQWGVSTKSVQSNISARVNTKVKQILDTNGKEVIGEGPILISSDIVISSTSRIRITKINGIVQSTALKERQIKSLLKGHGFGESHWEIYV